MRLILFLLLIPVFFVSCSKSSTQYVNNPGSPDYLHTRPVGASANELLAQDKYKSLKIEILYMTGFAPDPQAVEHMQSFLSGILNKPGGITIVTKEVPGTSKQMMTINDIIEVEKNQRTVFTTGTQIGVCIVYTNGAYTNAPTLGIAYRNTSAAIFGKTIIDNSGGLTKPSRTKLEATVLEHEMGHLLGLVDLGTEMQAPHKDADHGNHCNDRNCLMFFEAESTDILGFLLTGNIPALDGNCRADLTANGGR